ncbi:hypothetical protein RI129_004929 [Pyrocoelia pectoralis]|uniref:THAP-type domain-containing protein n=1 Tax=Pyrocoelia pectoralis TaxID=417401 RepID=A0AAN7VD89_9COLE
MVAIYCAVENCWKSTASKHVFPNPAKNMALFKKWVKLCGNERLYDMTPNKIFTNCRVCRNHFEDTDFLANNRLNRGAYPSKFLPEVVDIEMSQLLENIPSTSKADGRLVTPVMTTCITPTAGKY